MTDWRDAPYWRHIETKTRKAVSGGAAAIAWQNDIPLSRISADPCERAASFLQAYKVGWFYKAESKISGDIGSLDVTVAHEDDSGANEKVIIEPDLFTPFEQLDPIGQFLRLMERPNPSQTGRQLRQKTQIRLDMAGWTFWYMEGAGPEGSGVLPTAVYGISPARLTPSFDKGGTLIGWVLDANARGGGIPFETYEILSFVNASADDMWCGVGVVEAVWPEVPLSGQIAKHTSDLLSTGGRLAGMLWPKERALDESEFLDAQRAWRNVSSDQNAAKRLLLFPEPMEYAAGASTPAEIGIPDLANLNRDNILTAFPISPYQLGVPMPGGLNSAQQRVGTVGTTGKAPSALGWTCSRRRSKSGCCRCTSRSSARRTTSTSASRTSTTRPVSRPRPTRWTSSSCSGSRRSPRSTRSDSMRSNGSSLLHPSSRLHWYRLTRCLHKTRCRWNRCPPRRSRLRRPSFHATT